jgi:hypothetical protein
MGDLKATSQLQIERIARTNIADISAGLCALDWSVRARRVPPDFWPWLYFRNPAGDAVAIAAFDGHRPVGRFERIPVRVAVDGQTQTADLMQGLTLAPEFRQWTHLRRLLAAALRAESAEKPVFSFGFTTSAAARLNASLGHPVLGRVPVFAAVVDGTAMWRGRKFPSPVSAIAGPPLSSSQIVFHFGRIMGTSVPLAPLRGSSRFRSGAVDRLPLSGGFSWRQKTVQLVSPGFPKSYLSVLSRVKLAQKQHRPAIAYIDSQ